MEPPFRPNTRNETDVSNVDPEFLAEAPEETPVMDSELLKLSARDGDFDNFSFVNKHNLSEVDRASSVQGGKNRAKTEFRA